MGLLGKTHYFRKHPYIYIYLIPSSWHLACTSEAANNKGAISFTAEDKHRIELEPSSKQSNSWHPRPLAP